MCIFFVLCIRERASTVASVFALVKSFLFSFLFSFFFVWVVYSRARGGGEEAFWFFWHVKLTSVYTREVVRCGMVK